jgi:hypothetical protein
MDQLSVKDLETHVPILGWLFIIGNAVFLAIGIFVLILLGGIGMFSGDPQAARILVFIGFLVSILFVVIGLPGIIAGIALLARKAWGRVLAMVVGLLGLVNFPVGTAIGVYAFFVLLQESAKDYFE